MGPEAPSFGGAPKRRSIQMRVDTKQTDISIPDDDHRYFGFPYHLVFDASVYVLEKMGLRISFSNIFQGRVIASRGKDKGHRVGHLDVRIIGKGAVTFVHVKAGSGTVSSRDDTGRLRRHFLWELDELLHKSKVEQLNKVQETVASSHGKPNGGYVPPKTAYKLSPHDSHHEWTGPAGLVWVPAGQVHGYGVPSPNGDTAGLRGRWGPNPTPGDLFPSRGHRDHSPRSNTVDGEWDR